MVDHWMKASVEVRFWQKVERSDGCWIWTGERHNHGYGRMIVGGRRRYAHRMAWELTQGPIAAGLHVLHRCDNPPCVRPDHLFLGTAADNLRDMRSKGRGSLPPLKKPLGRTACTNGHEFTPDNTYVNPRGHRECRTCARAHQAAYRERRRTRRLAVARG